MYTVTSQPQPAPGSVAGRGPAVQTAAGPTLLSIIIVLLSLSLPLLLLLVLLFFFFLLLLLLTITTIITIIISIIRAPGGCGLRPGLRPGQAGGDQKEPFVRGLWAEVRELWTGRAEEAVVRRLRKKARRANECESQGSSGNGGGRPRQLSTALRGAAARGLAAALE